MFVYTSMFPFWLFLEAWISHHHLMPESCVQRTSALIISDIVIRKSYVSDNSRSLHIIQLLYF